MEYWNSGIKKFLNLYRLWAIFLFLAIFGMIFREARGDIPSAFADIGYGARPMGMGGAYVALASDSYSVLWNPAGLPFVRGWQISTMYTKQFRIVPYTLATAAKCFRNRYGMGAAVLSSGDDVWRETTVFVSGGIRLSNLGSNFDNLTAGLTLKIRTVSFGNNANGGTSQIQGSASGYGLDLGMRWKFAEKWIVGVLFRDALNKVTYNNETREEKYGEAVPAALIMGTAYLAKKNLVFVLDWDKALYRDVKDKVLVGFEWLLFKIIYLRGGWSQTLDIDPNRKLNWGLGLQYFHKKFGVRFDFAYQDHFLATTPRVSTSFWF